MAIYIQLGRTTKRRNSVSLPSQPQFVVPVLLKDEVSIVRPVFRLHVGESNMGTALELFKCNYVYCESMHRYYWITNIEHITNDVYDVYCETDVLATWEKDIKNTNAFVMYSASHSNSMLPDSRLPISDVSYQHSIVTNMDLISDDDGTFILSAASQEANGTTGPVQMYALAPGQMKELCSLLYKKDIWGEVAEIVYSPTDALVSCTWLPLDIGFCSDGSGTLMLNEVIYGNANYAKKTHSNEFTVTPWVPYHSTHFDENGNEVTSWADYRNCEPYTKYSVSLPGVGLVEIPMISLIGTGESAPQFKVKYDIAISTGEITYYICRINDIEGAADYENAVLTVKGNIGQNIPVSGYSGGTLQGIMSLISAGVGTAVSVFVPNALPFMAGSVISQTMSGVMQINQSAMQASGSVGGFASNLDVMNNCYCITRQYIISDEPHHASPELALPLFKLKRIGDLHGLCFLQNANVHTGEINEAGATLEEHTLLSAMLNGGGVYIE